MKPPWSARLSPSFRSRLPVVLAVAGAMVGWFDLGLFRLAGARVVMGESDVTTTVILVYAANFAVLGWVIGSLLVARARQHDDALTIRAKVAALEESRARLLQAEKLASLGRMAAGVAHEVRNPLGVIRSSAMLVAEGLPRDADPDLAQACTFIRDEVDRLDAFVTEILGYARPLRPRRGPVSLGEVGRQAACLAATHLGPCQVRQPEEDAVVDGDRDLLVQLVLGLLVNAAEAGASVVGLRVEKDADGVALLVQDDGRGVDPGLVPQLFEPFFTTKARGTGLGLAMAARVAEAHRGALSFVPRDAGACFALRLPAESA